jgi:hypothetical protein
MVWGRLFDLLALIVSVGAAIAILGNPNTQGAITAAGNAYTNALGTALKG